MGKTTLNRDLWHSELNNDEDKAFLCNDVCSGFKLIETGTSFLNVDMDNYKSATNLGSISAVLSGPVFVPILACVAGVVSF